MSYTVNSTTDIGKMDFKQLREKVIELESIVAKMKRYLEDALSNLDTDNFSTSFIKEQGNMKAQIKMTAESLTSEYARIDENMTEFTSKIEQTADKISTQVSEIREDVGSLSTSIDQTSDNIKLIALKGINACFEATSCPDNPSEEEKNMLCKTGDTYWYYDNLSGEWKDYPSDGKVMTMFKQSADGFELIGNVYLKNNSSINISQSATIGSGIFLNLNGAPEGYLSNGITWFYDKNNDNIFSENDTPAACITYWNGGNFSGEDYDIYKGDLFLGGVNGIVLNDTLNSVGGTNTRRVLTTHDKIVAVFG